MTGEVGMGLGGFSRAGSALMAAFVLALGCGGTSIDHAQGAPGTGGARGGGSVTVHTENRFVSALNANAVAQLDLLLMVDNSIGMADKQALFAEAVPELVQRFTSPLCVDPTTGLADRSKTPADPSEPCPGGLTRQFRPLRDIHVGLITSSLGGHGSTTLCVGNDSGTIADQEADDHGWLLGTRPRFITPMGGAPADEKGFLDWNPDSKPGETFAQFSASLTSMTVQAGEFGCGLESQLEAFYRFLVDPQPYHTIVQQNCPGSSEPCAVPQGVDTNLLAQRAAFLRPNSVLAVVMLTDENDCSIRESGQYFYAARDNIILPHGSSTCVLNPNDACCYFCNAAVPPGCPPDPSCQAPTPRDQDPPNLRCFHEMQRFGFDFLYPTSRYVNALTEPQLCTSRADLAADPTNCKDLNGDKQPDIFDNPLFVGPSGAAATPRDSSLIYFASVVGVPWQDLATNTKPDGTMYPPNELHYRAARQLAQDNVWSVILGDDNPGNHAPPILPTDALMIESKDPRGGEDGENPPRPLAGTNTGYLANPVNGHERANSNQDDLQYACIFRLPDTRDCTALIAQNPPPGCDCKPGNETDNNPLCQAPTGAYSTVQGFAKAYPGLRELKVVKDFGNNGIVASICPRNVIDKNAQDYGYRPAVDAIVDAVGPAFTGKCLPRTLTPDADGKIPCSIVEAVPGDSACDAAHARSDPDPDLRKSVLAEMKQVKLCDVGGKPPCSAYSLCRIDEAGESCHQNQPPTEAGWCYVDPVMNRSDDSSLVAGCPATQRRILRFVDPEGQTPAPDATVFLACQ